jgi:hypothetical protein
MDDTRQQFANRCLPLLVANQAGWFILNSHPLRVTWNGGPDPESTIVELPESMEGICLYDAQSPPATSHFGHGIVTWHLPYLFRTPPGYNLLARGPANCPKDGASPLEGIVETDWSMATFTMNWQLTRPGLTVTFEVGEPICMIVPQRRGELETFRPEIREVETAPEIASGYRAWSKSREQFLAGLKEPRSEALRNAWEKHYFRGTAPSGVQAPEHQVKLKLREFEEGSG